MSTPATTPITVSNYKIMPFQTSTLCQKDSYKPAGKGRCCCHIVNLEASRSIGRLFWLFGVVPNNWLWLCAGRVGCCTSDVLNNPETLFLALPLIVVVKLSIVVDSSGVSCAVSANDLVRNRPPNHSHFIYHILTAVGTRVTHRKTVTLPVLIAVAATHYQQSHYQQPAPTVH